MVRDNTCGSTRGKVQFYQAQFGFKVYLTYSGPQIVLRLCRFGGVLIKKRSTCIRAIFLGRISMVIICLMAIAIALKGRLLTMYFMYF